MGRIKRITTLAVLCGLLLLSILFQIISKSSAYFLSVFDKSGVNSVMVELIFDRLDFTDPDIAALDDTYYDEKDGVEIPWGSKSNPYVISQKYHVQNLSVLQNSGFFAERTETDADGNEIPVQPYFLVCTPEGDPVAIDCDGMTIDPIGTKEQPFTGVIQGAPIAGEASYKSYGVSVSTIANLTVNAKTDNPDIGFFGHAGYYGNYDPNTATLTGGYAATIENLLFADVTIKSTKSLTKTLAEWWDTLFPNHLHYLETRAETHHVGIIAGHAEFATIKNVSVYYSEDVAAFDLVSDAEGSNTNYYSSTGLIGLLQYVNPARDDNTGTLDGSGAVSDSQITDGESGGGGEESGTLTGYFLAESLYDEHEKFLIADNGKGADPQHELKNSYNVLEMRDSDGNSLFSAVTMKEKSALIGSSKNVTYYYFADSVFTFTMSMSNPEGTTVDTVDPVKSDYVKKIWDIEPKKIYGTSSKDKFHFADDLSSTSRVSYLLTAVTGTSDFTDGGYYLLAHYDYENSILYIYQPSSGATGKMISFAKDAEEIYYGDEDNALETTYFDSEKHYIKSINLIGTNKQYHDLAFKYNATASASITDPATGDKLGATSETGNGGYLASTLYYGPAERKTSATLSDTNPTAYVYNWSFGMIDNGRNGLFTVSNTYTLTRTLLGFIPTSTTYCWSKLNHTGNTIGLVSDANTDSSNLNELTFDAATDYFTIFKISTNTLDSSGNIIVTPGEENGNKELTPKNIIPTMTTDSEGNKKLDTLYEFDPSTHVLEYDSETGTYILSPIRRYKFNNGKGKLLTSLNHITRLASATTASGQLNLFDEDSFLSFLNTNKGGVVGTTIGKNGTYAAIPAGMIAFEINEASETDPSFINIIVAVNPERTDENGFVGLWRYDIGATQVEFDLTSPNTEQSFVLPISKTATSWETDNKYIFNVSERYKEDDDKENGKKTYSVAQNADGTQESSYVYLGGETAFVYYKFEATEPGIYFVGANSIPLSVSYFSVSGAAGAGSDGMTGSPLGFVDFVYDFGNSIVTVDKLYTEDEQLLNDEDYTQYYPSFLFVSMLPEKENGSISKIQNEKIKLRRYIADENTDTFGTRRHISMTGENLTKLRGVSEVLEDLQDDIDNDTDSN